MTNFTNARSGLYQRRNRGWLVTLVAAAMTVLFMAGMAGLGGSTPARAGTASASGRAAAASHGAPSSATGPSHPQTREFPLSRLPAAARAGSDVTAAPAGSFEIVNSDHSYCLDANDEGSTAGKNGDKVQLWTCSGNDNQYWKPGKCVGDWCQLINTKYTSECLNADDTGGLGEGSKAQLWSCNVASPYNDLWDVSDWEGCTNTYIYCTLTVEDGGGNYILTAKLPLASPPGGNGDQAQMWLYTNDTGQFWGAY